MNGAPSCSLRVLIIEDSEDDALLMRLALENGGRSVSLARVDTEAQLRARLAEGAWDIILSDWSLPSFGGSAALAVRRELGLDVPFLIVSGTIGEERVVEALRSGASDYLMKDHIDRLPATVERVLAEAHRRREKEAADAKLRESEERFRLLVEGAIDYAMFHVGRMGFVESWNSGAQRLLGWEEAEVVGRHVSFLFLPEDTAEGVPDRVLQAALRGGGSLEERWLVLKSGERFWASGSVTALVSDDGSVRGFGFVLRDRTDRKAHEEELRHLYEEAQRVNRLKDEFLATLSHELRTPLNVVLGYAELLRLDVPPESPLMRPIDAIIRNAKVQNQLVNDLLDISRIVTGKLTLDRSEVALPAVIDGAVQAVELAASVKGVRIARPALSCPTVIGDAARLQQVIWNLLSNAVKFTPQGGRVLVETGCSDGFVYVRVQDDGKGIEPAFLPYVFERFRQEDSSKNRVYGGLGLGLSIVKTIVEAHGGQVEAQSRGQGLGSRFTVRLRPYDAALVALEGCGERPAIDTATTGDALSTAALHRNLDGMRVLVVDDHPDALSLVAHVLTQAGARVDLASSGEEAIDRFARFRPNAIVSDVSMPGMDGYDVIRRIRREYDPGKAVPAIALTANVREEDRMEALEAGYDLHLGKPVEPQELVRALRRIVAFPGTASGRASDDGRGQ